MNGSKRFLAILIAAVMMLALMIPSAFADSSLAGTDWILNKYEMADGSAVCTVLTQKAAIDWIGFYYKVSFYSADRYRLYYVDESTTESIDGSWYESGGTVYMAEDGGGDYSFTIGNDGMLYTETSGGDWLGFSMEGTQSYTAPGGDAASGNRFFEQSPSGNNAADPFSGTTWAATSIDTIYSGINVGGDDFDLSIGDILSLATFVQTEAQLRSGMVMLGILCSIDFRTDHTFTLTMMTSAFGQVQEESTSSMSGTWEYANGTLNLTIDGQTAACIYQGGQFSMGVYGVNLVFQPVSY